MKASAEAAKTAPRPSTEPAIAVKSPKATPRRLARATRVPELIAWPVTIKVVGPGMAMDDRRRRGKGEPELE